MPSPIADSFSVIIFLSNLILFGITFGIVFPIWLNTNKLVADPANCSGCPKICTTASDCPSVLFSSNFNASTSCTSGGCIYEYVPLSIIPLPVGFLGDQFCEQKVLRAPPCFKVVALPDCNGMLIECYGGFQCQFWS